MARKIVTTEEKKGRLLNFFKEEFSFYNIKDIESTGSKKTGISSMLIKDILQMLIDDDLVKVEKCGSMNLYWSFEYDLTKSLISKYRFITRSIEDSKIQKKKLTAQINDEKKNRQKIINKNLKRIDLQKQITNLQKEKNEQVNRLEGLKKNDPERIKDLQQRLLNAYYEAEKHTNNVECVIYYLSRENGLQSTELRQQLEVPEYEAMNEPPRMDLV